MRTDKQIMKAVMIAVESEDGAIKASCPAILDAHTLIRRRSADDDLEQQMISMEAANYVLQGNILDETGITLHINRLDERRLTAIWMNDQGYTFIPGIEFGKHNRCRIAGNTIKQLIKNPENYFAADQGTDRRAGMLNAEEKAMMSRFKGMVTTAVNLHAREERDALRADRDDDPQREVMHSVTARELALAIPHLRRALDERNG